MTELELDHNVEVIVDPPLDDDGSHRFWHHRNPFRAVQCSFIELRMWRRGIHPLQKH